MAQPLPFIRLPRRLDPARAQNRRVVLAEMIDDLQILTLEQPGAVRALALIARELAKKYRTPTPTG